MESTTGMVRQILKFKCCTYSAIDSGYRLESNLCIFKNDYLENSKGMKYKIRICSLCMTCTEIPKVRICSGRGFAFYDAVMGS